MSNSVNTIIAEFKPTICHMVVLTVHNLQQAHCSL